MNVWMVSGIGVLLGAALVVICAGLVLASPSGAWAKPKTSTPEDRAKAVSYAKELEANPLSEDAVAKRRWLIEWYAKIPDITVMLCDLLVPYPEAKHPFFPSVMVQMAFANGAFQIEHPDRRDDRVACQLAGVEGALTVYQNCLKAMPEGRLPFLDELLERRAQGTLKAYVRDKISKSCGN